MLGGTIQRVRVSACELWDVGTFIEHYLRRHHFELTDRNRRLLLEMVNAYPGKNPPRREELVRFLDAAVSAAARESAAKPEPSR